MIAWAATWPWRWRPSGKQSTQIAGTHGSEKTQSRTTILKRAIFYYNERPLLLTQWWLKSSVHWVVSINFSSPPLLVVVYDFKRPPPVAPAVPLGLDASCDPFNQHPPALAPPGQMLQNIICLNWRDTAIYFNDFVPAVLHQEIAII